ncbi:MAG: hypothetical protein K6C94_06965 [Candidatus Gastranaerophilales bacterium]|nr:hypothetical protein [Candidatus Gastranaerophilales bacterium]
MDKKCNKYEAYYTFADEATFSEHLRECEDCRNEFEKEQRLSELIKDASGEYRRLEQKKKTKNALMKTACALLIFSTIGLYSGFQVQKNCKYRQFMKSNTEVSVIAQEGLPVDDMGFFDYN